MKSGLMGRMRKLKAKLHFDEWWSKKGHNPEKVKKILHDRAGSKS